MRSPFCLAEMGVAWALNQKIYPLLIDPITYDDINKTPFLEFSI